MATKSLADESQERALIIAAQNGDVEAFARLWQFYWKKVWALCSHIVGTRGDSEALAQEALLKAWVELVKFDTQKFSQFGGFIFRIARNICIDYLRRVGRIEKEVAGIFSIDEPIGDDERGTTLGDILPPVETQNLEEDYVLQVTFKQCLSKLSADKQIALLFIFYEGGSFEELGWKLEQKKETSLTHNAAFNRGKYHVRIALENLARCLRASGVQLAPSQLLQLFEEQGNGGLTSYETNEH